ncbi:MAG TPA: SIMPL domain-containing protein [Bacteroidales bacterium]|nr:SIMPL domain-containing protein [Bacteroidales bacterium]
MESKNRIIVAALIMGIGIAIAGLFISQTLIKARALERYVTVKGLSEREVMADLAIWPVEITIASNDLKQLEEDLLRQTGTIQGFLEDQGFSEEEITIGSPNIQDTRANLYGGNSSGSQYRYVAGRDITIRTSDIKKLHETLEQIPSLISKGIIMGSKNYWQQIEYLYTRLNDIKPAMIEEATKNAREAAEKFARDSESKVGKIKSASQGLFSIENRDINTGHIKKVRVVNSVVFYLED